MTILKSSQICTNTLRNNFFEDILFLALFPIEIFIVNQILPSPEIIGLERKQKQFSNGTTVKNKLGTCTF